MKVILYIYHASNIGGGSYALLNVIKSLDKTKYKPVVLLKKDGPLVEELKKCGVSVYFCSLLNTVPYNKDIYTVTNLVRIVRIFFSLEKFREILRIVNPDIVYFNTMMLHPYLRVAKEQGKKTIIHIREHWPLEEHKMQRRYAINSIKKYADEIIAINEYSASMFSDEYCKPKIVYDWIDMSVRFEQRYYDDIFKENCSDLKIYLVPGGYDSIKGTLEIIKVFSANIKDLNSRLLILGTKPRIQRNNFIKRLFISSKSYSELLEEEICKDTRIKIIPNTYYVTHIYQQAYCVLSYFKIPHANLALAENIILKVPMIAAKTEESLEYSLNGELAILFEANNERDFKNKIVMLDDNIEHLRKKLNLKANLIECKFNPQKNIEKLNQIYNNI